MVNILLRNFYYKLFAKHKYGHGIHSPFVYDFIKNILNNDKIKFEDLNLIKACILKEVSYIQRSEYNKNSKALFKSKKISVKRFLKYSSLNEKYGSLLNKMVKYYNISCVIELGTGLGISAYYFLYKNDNLFLHTIEGNNELAKISYELLYGNGFKNFKVYNCNFKEGLDLILYEIQDKEKLLFFIDGDHIGKHLQYYIEKILSNLKKDECYIVIDDIRWSTDMYNAWKDITKNSNINLSIDLGRMGILIKKPQFLKQYFMIRY